MRVKYGKKVEKVLFEQIMPASYAISRRSSMKDRGHYEELAGLRIDYVTILRMNFTVNFLSNT